MNQVLKKQTPESGTIEFVNSGQICIIDDIDTRGLPVPDFANHMIEGWWALDEEGGKRIKRAVPGMKVYFHIKTEGIEDGKTIRARLFEDDSYEKERPNGDTPIPIVNLKTGIVLSEYYPVKNNKVLIPLTLEINEQALATDADHRLEFKFICSYEGQNRLFPKDRDDFLVVGALIIDRYKMPGLNPQGDGIAEDMAYGTGHPNKERKIYSDAELAQYKKDYADLGFNIALHGEFANAKPKETELQEITLTAKRKPLPKLPPMPIDNLRVENKPLPLSPEQIRTLNEKNEKAIYSREEIEKLGNLMEFSMETDFRLWFNFRTLKAALVWGKLSNVLDDYDR